LLPPHYALKKLEMAIGTIHDWFASYLKDKSKGNIKGSFSSVKTCHSRLYIGPHSIPHLQNDLYNATALLQLMFVDDTACVASDTNLNNLIIDGQWWAKSQLLRYCDVTYQVIPNIVRKSIILTRFCIF
jgi:hypothetical protein